MNASASSPSAPSECYALQCFAAGRCVLYVDRYADGSLAALHGRPGSSQPTHSQWWAPPATRTTRPTALLGQLLRYIHPELTADPRELPVFALAPVTADVPVPWPEPRNN